MGRFILSGHNIDDGITPVFTRSDGGGSFYGGDYVLYDQVLEYAGSTSVRKTLSFTSGATDPLQTQISGGAVTVVDITTIPLQFAVTVVKSWSVRRISEEGGSTGLTNPGGLPFGDDLGIWYNHSTSRQWRLARPGVGVTVENTSVYELANNADLSTIMARATITLRYIRP